MRQVFPLVLASTAMVLLTSPGFAKEKSTLDLAPLLDGFVEGCNFGEPLYELIASLRPATREGETLAVPAEYASVAGEPTHTADDYGNQEYHLPLPGQWHGVNVAGIDFVNQDDAGLFVAAVRFSGSESAVNAQFESKVTASQAILDQDEMSVDFGHLVALTTDDGITRLLCDLST